jgi:hypothetical protein
VRVLVANEPRSYREAFAFAFRTLRPHAEAIVIEPEALEHEALRLRPDLVVCDRVTPAVAAITRSWMELRVEDEVLVAASDGLAPGVRDVSLDDLIAFIDRNEETIQR